jgi:hypothetical protein
LAVAPVAHPSPMPVRWHAPRAWLGSPPSRSHPYGTGAWCIHEREAAWNDESASQQGGMQEDYGFQHTYGLEFVRRWGDAGHWPAWAQLEAAWRAYHGYHGYKARGWSPWPNTSRMCGLR